MSIDLNNYADIKKVVSDSEYAKNKHLIVRISLLYWDLYISNIN